jgi:hypothetical protein
MDEVIDKGNGGGDQHNAQDLNNNPLNLFQYLEQDPDELPATNKEDDTCSPSEADNTTASMVTIPDGNASEHFPDFVIMIEYNNGSLRPTVRAMNEKVQKFIKDMMFHLGSGTEAKFVCKTVAAGSQH